MEINRKLKIYNDSSDSDDDDSVKSNKKQKIKTNVTEEIINCDKKQNIILKLYNRERTGYFANSPRKKRRENAFNKVPSYLTFCLKNIVPFCYLQGHVFMGLTACGQFLLSYKVSYNDESITNVYNFSTGYNYKYELFFWIYRPHMLLGKYYNVCLFDDHGVDNLKTVTMSQWLTKSRTLIIHGASEYDNEDSYITIVSVPKLGCLDCKKFRDEYSDNNIRCDALCIKCNLTIHTKYNRSDSDPKFNPKIYLSCPEYIIMIANGFIHMINIVLDVPTPIIKSSTQLQQAMMNTTTTPIDLQFLDDGIATTNNYIKKNSHIEYHQQQHYDKRMLNLIDDTTSTITTAKTTVTSPSTTKLQLTNNINNNKKITTSVATNSNNNENGCVKNNKISIVERIIADFAECETDNTTLDKTLLFSRIDKSVLNNANNFGELVITCGTTGNTNNQNNNQNQNNKQEIIKTNVQLLKYNNKRNNCNKIMNRNLLRTTNNCITKIDLNSSTIPTTTSVAATSATGDEETTAATSSSTKFLEKINLDIASKAYEFSEDNEKCEKISIFRKRRLADKKYEFSEDNSENIIPFNKIRSMYKKLPYRSKMRLQQTSSTTTSSATISSQNNNNQNNLFSPAPPNYEVTSHLHRASPNHGFRSPCGSPVGNRCLRSPPGFSKSAYFNARSPTYTMRSPNTLSPRQHQQQQQQQPPQQPKKYDDLENMMKFVSGNSPLLNSTIQQTTINNDIKLLKNDTIIESATIQNNSSVIDKPICSKKFVRRFVEEDDATSVITSEEDDCISPGYHTSLPMEVHGSGYSDMQMISRCSYNKLKCPTVIITQHSFDLETFTFHVANHLCTINNKKYGIFYDWACELIDICPVSCILSLLLMVHFTARDQLPTELKQCLNCTNNLDCVFHRKMYQCRTFFTWNIENGDWNILDYGDLIEIEQLTTINNKNNVGELNITAKKIANEISINYKNNHNIFNNLWILDSRIEKSKDTLKDLNNSIEFYRFSDNDSEFSDLNDSDNDI